MVAITVILAAVIGTFVLGLGDQVQSSAPNANFQFEYGGDWSSDTGTLTVVHNGGQDVLTDNLEVQVGTSTVSSGNFTNDWSGSGTTISTGDSANFQEPSGSLSAAASVSDESAGADVRVVWNSPNGDSSNTIGSSTTPN
jgi:FlaG/FlaF family flagellin (archaellin)